MTDRISPQQDEVVQETSFTEEPLLRRDSGAPEERRDGNASQSQSQRNNYGSISVAANGAGASNGTNKTANTPAKPARDLAPDLLRGVLMALMAFDHAGVNLRVWPHGQGIHSELDSTIVDKFNWWLPYTIRTLTHLCASGFTFLLGMGIVYFGRSRARLGWSTGKMARHFFLRAVVLTLVSIVFGMVLSGFQVWFLNIVLFALAVDYLIAGLVYLLFSGTEQALARLLVREIPDEPEEEVREPMLSAPPGEDETVLRSSDRVIVRASRISWHVHNLMLLALGVVTIWWNIWMSPSHGYCKPQESEVLPTTASSAAAAAPPSPVTEGFWPILRDIWFYPLLGHRVMSGFPPMGWLSFAILGLLYGRVVLAQRWSPRAVNIGNALAAAGFLLVFALTRVLRFGNLSEDCLQTPAQAGAAEGSNPYLQSARSFFYTVKYPPDVAFWAYTLGGNFVILVLLGVIPTGVSKRFGVLLAYGTSALFFYIVHMLLLLLAAIPLVGLFGEELGYDDELTGKPAVGVKSVPAFFALWATVLAVMYPLCRWYGSFKARQGPDSLWRFF